MLEFPNGKNPPLGVPLIRIGVLQFMGRSMTCFNELENLSSFQTPAALRISPTRSFPPLLLGSPELSQLVNGDVELSVHRLKGGVVLLVHRHVPKVWMEFRPIQTRRDSGWEK